jgi:hypothetical protein
MAADRQPDRNTCRPEQFLNIALCGAIGGVMAAMYFADGGLKLASLFGADKALYSRVLVGGIALLGIVLLRIVQVWWASDPKPMPSVNHGDDGDDRPVSRFDPEFGEGFRPAAESSRPALATISHSHGDASSAGKRYDCRCAPWRHVLLAFPVVIFALGLPRIAVSSAPEFEVEYKLNLGQATSAGQNVESRGMLDGKTVCVTGQFNDASSDGFTLMQLKHSSVRSDRFETLTVKVIIPPSLREKYQINPAHYRGKWVSVIGELHFVAEGTLRGWKTVVILSPDDDPPLSKIVRVVPEPNSIYAD